MNKMETKVLATTFVYDTEDNEEAVDFRVTLYKFVFENRIQEYIIFLNNEIYSRQDNLVEAIKEYNKAVEDTLL